MKNDGRESHTRAHRLTGGLSVLCLALMLALMVAGGASLVELTLIALGGGLVLTACALADQGARHDED
jgi:hypothetical protein